MTLYDLVRELADRLRRFADRRLKPEPTIADDMARVNTLEEWEAEQHRVRLIAIQNQHEVHRNSPYRNILDRLVKDEPVTLAEWDRTRGYLYRKFSA